MPAQALHHRLGKPAGVAELDRVPPVGQGVEPRAETFVVAVEVRRQLPQHRTETAGLDQGFDPLVEALDALTEVAQTPDVCQIATRLDGEGERIGRLAHPRRDRFPARQSVEGRVDLDGVEALGVELEPATLRLTRRIETSAPIVVIPSGTPDADRLHTGKARSSRVLFARGVVPRSRSVSRCGASVMPCRSVVLASCGRGRRRR